MQRYFVDDNKIDIVNKRVIIDGKDYHHIKNVMRMKLLDKIIIFSSNDANDGFINQFLGKIIKISDVIEVEIMDEICNETELDCEIYIAHGLVRKEKSEEVLKRLVELGASGYFNVSMERSVVKSKENNTNLIIRRNQIIKEATEQSERGKLMKSLNTMDFKDFLEFSKDFPIKLICYEGSGRNNDHTLKGVLPQMAKSKVLALVGPEGGISPKELKLCVEKGFICIGLGKRILRTETAPLYLMSVIAFGLENGGENE